MNRIFNLPRTVKRLISVSIDSIFIISAFWSAMFLHNEKNIDLINTDYWFMLGFVMLISIAININLGLYRAVIRFLNTRALIITIISVFSSSTLIFISSFIIDATIPRSIPVIYGAFLLILVGGSRLIIRTWAHSLYAHEKNKVLIYGAGSSGIQLANALAKGKEYTPIAFIDDDKRLHSLNINGIKVHPPKNIPNLIKRFNFKSILMAMPSASKTQRAAILNNLEKYSLEVLAVPGMSDLVSGKAKIDDIVEVSIEDLLGRDQVRPNQDLMAADIYKKVVMVTGAGGSIGSELCRQIIIQQPKALLLFELTEFALYSIHHELSIYIQENKLDVSLYPFLGSVTNQSQLEKVMGTFNVETVYHAAAYKHVPLVEHNVIEGVKNNIFGTLRCAQAAINSQVSTFVLISTDKAVRPTNVMGTTKRMAELCLQALSHTNGHSTRFCMVRFGNVLGSSGSVVPLFKSQIKRGGPITLTHKDITRYFMTIQEASQLVIQAGAMGMGGDVFVLDMGKPVKIYSLAYKMIHLSGLHLKSSENPHGDIEIIETGLRPGEKLYEELLIGDDVDTTGNERIMTASEKFLPWEELNIMLNDLDEACENFDQKSIRDILLNAPTGFNPTDDICDLIYKNRK